MRHEVLNKHDSVNARDVAAVWPATAQLAPLPIPEPVETRESMTATAAAPDVPAAAGLMIVGTYVALLAALAVATVAGGKSLFAIVIAAFFVLMFFSVPAVFLGIDAANGPRQSFSRFMSEGLQTYTGHSTGKAALVQMLVVPVLLTFGVICMGVAAAFIF